MKNLSLMLFMAISFAICYPVNGYSKAVNDNKPAYHILMPQDAKSAEFNSLLSSYYKEPHPELIPDALQYILQNNILNKDNFWPLAYIFGKIALMNPTLVDNYLDILDNQNEYKKRLFVVYALTICGNDKVRSHLDSKLSDPEWANDKKLLDSALKQKFPLPYSPIETDVTSSNDLDMLWAEFFVTGDTEAVSKIIHVINRDDLFLAKVNNYLKTHHSDKEIAEFKETLFNNIGIELTIEHNRVVTDRDIDIQYCENTVSGQYAVEGNKHVRLLLGISDEEFYNLALKNVALWGVRSNAMNHKAVAETVIKEYLSLRSTIQVYLKYIK